ncbi:uncharacterized protein LOC126827526 [Patella vulgata]|uniref:uncharacterized protein LOC126827526 n=1 Tax=Patella vulgata TaxID=6465 RepID=UPI0021809A14|nr:uncharacterized protein LOC126827526 [Patella vulgata]XP_050412928.1 uncharacterized protein LOC126827526 [Patella vulgata]
MAVVYVLLVVLVTQASCLKPCRMEDDECVFHFDLNYNLTMVKDRDALYPKGGKLYKYDIINTTSATPVSIEGVATADGWEDSRLVILVNGLFPGPQMEVYEGQTIIVHVTNSLMSEAVTIHWHGLHQRGTPWMDGVAFITQCPVLPGQSFTYRFKARPKGTFWYHTHIGGIRSMGPYGALIIREKKRLREEEFVFTVTEWNHDWDSNLLQTKRQEGMYADRQRIRSTHSLDGAGYSSFGFHSALINGRGRYYDPDTGKDNEAPLEVFTVTQDARFVFRVISVGVELPFRISIDNHDLTIIATDGYDLRPFTAESFVINPGERYDFRIRADKPVDNYWIRAKTLEVGVDHFGLAILRYEGAPDTDPNSSRQTCTDRSKCVVVNCPFLFYPEDDNIECVTFDQLRSKDGDPAPSAPIGRKEEHFLNFGFDGVSGWVGSVNGRSFKMPPVSALTQPDQIGLKCDDDCGVKKSCQCPYSLDLDHGKTYQIIFLNMGDGKGYSHPIHMHGHSYYVLKMGYPRYSATTGKLIGDNPDINCRESSCNDATWADPHWHGDNIPGLELKNPPRKDTIIVPTGGYVVVRIVADNPGLWFMHCHMELHSIIGMALVLNISFPLVPQPPPGFPTCGNFHYKTPAPKNKYLIDKDDEGADDHLDVLDHIMIFQTIIGCLVVLVGIQFVLLVHTCRKASAKPQNELLQPLLQYK